MYLVLVGKISYRKKTYWPSCCEVRYGIDMEIQPFLFKVLEEFSFYKMSNSIVSHILLNGKQIPTKAKYHDKTFYICYLFFCWALSNFVHPCWESYHAFKIKITYMPPNICTTPTLGVGAKTCLPPRSIQKCSTPTLGVKKKYLLGSIKINAPHPCWYLSQKCHCKKRHEAIIGIY